MGIRISEIHPPDAPDQLNTEWFVLENDGDKPFNTRNCTLSISRPGHRKRTELGTIDPGFVLAPGEKKRVITGNPGRKSHGEMPPEDDTLQNYSLFLNDTVLREPGTTLTLALRTLPICKAVFDPEEEGNVGVKKPAAPGEDSSRKKRSRKKR